MDSSPSPRGYLQRTLPPPPSAGRREAGTFSSPGDSSRSKAPHDLSNNKDAASLPFLRPKATSTGGGPPGTSIEAIVRGLPIPTSVKKNFLPKRSLEYIVCAVSLLIPVCYIGFYQITLVSWDYNSVIKGNLKPPYAPFRWFGSVGVDVTDRQWYYFVVAAPPLMPIIFVFLVLTRWARGSTMSRTVMIEDSPDGLWHTEDSNVAAVAIAHEADDGARNKSLQVNNAAGGAEGEEGEDVYRMPRNLIRLQCAHLCFGFAIAFLLCGPGFLFGSLLMAVNYFAVARLPESVPYRVRMSIMWIGHIGMLFINFHAGGYRFAWFGLSFLDSMWSPVFAWTTQYNFSVLRMIAFNNDYWEARTIGHARRQRTLEKHDRSCLECAEMRDRFRGAAPSISPESLRCYKCRTECSRLVGEYSFMAYLAYLFYPPLFVAGPIIGFNAYVSFAHHPARSQTKRQIARYGVRVAVNMLLLFTWMHYNHIMALIATVPEQDGEIAYKYNNALGETGFVGKYKSGVRLLRSLEFTLQIRLGFLGLAFVWAKLNALWKFFRLFALLDGMDPPENMRRCFCNTVNIQGFWRDWHASFNLWIVRYMYIPMGGASKKFLSIFPIFFFIAIWHDIELRLLLWALIICVCFIPEIIITGFFSSKHRAALRIKRLPVYRLLRVLGAECGMLTLIVPNLIGFVMDFSAIGESLAKVTNEMSPLFLFLTLYLFFCAGNIAIQDRDQKAYEEQVLRLNYNLVN